jgi:WD40 repeat protein
LRVPCTSGIRSVAFSPDGTHALQLAVGLEDGSIQRLDLRLGSQKAVLDRLPVAHVGPVLSLDWVPASGAPWTTSPTSSLVDSEGPLSAATTPADRDKAGWLASAGMDKTVKVGNGPPWFTCQI